MNYLELYKKWSKTGFIEDRPNAQGSSGLCNTIICNSKSGMKKLDMFSPQYITKDDEPICGVYWAADNMKGRAYKFTDIRKNIVLFLAAMEGQL